MKFISLCSPGIFNLLSSRANLHISYNPAGRSHCRLQNHHGYIKHHQRGMGGSASFSNPCIASPTSRLILQPFRRFTYVTAHSTTLQPLHLRHRSFYNPSVASPTSQALHVFHLASRPCIEWWKNSLWRISLLQQVNKFRSSYSFG